MGEHWDWPRDPDRYKFFPDSAKKHPAKMNIRMYLRLMELYSQEGDTILDPMSGVGTVHMAAWHKRKTIGLELNPEFVVIQHESVASLSKAYGRDPDYTPQIVPGDCRRHLPLKDPVDVVIFSPPYGNTIKAGRTSGFKDVKEESLVTSYGGQAASVGELDMANYNFAMKLIYKGLWDSLREGGHMVTVTQDFIRKRKRVTVSNYNIQMALQAGFGPPIEWHTRTSPGGYGAIVERKERARLMEEGKIAIVEENVNEDAIVFRKEAK